MTTEIRPEVMKFAEEMERVLREHDAKGTDLERFDLQYVVTRLWEEFREFAEAHAAGHLGEAQQEVIDIANFCMMYFLGRKP